MWRRRQVFFAHASFSHRFFSAFALVSVARCQARCFMLEPALCAFFLSFFFLFFGEGTAALISSHAQFLHETPANK
jgi:hypothetical protein